MNGVLGGAGTDVLAEWFAQRASAGAESRCVPEDGVRFAFYGRVSTSRYQDRASSAGWQRDYACELVAGHGAVVVDFFDVGCSRRRPWMDRPQAARLLAAVADPGRGFDAIVVGEYERAFFGTQLTHLAPLFQEYGVALWLPEAGGPLDFDDATHRALITMLGAQSKREVLRSRFRVLAAMETQVREQGRYVGGRPPYGYQLADGGRHPNAAHAGWGRRLRMLVADPSAAPVVRWMFAQRLAGVSLAGIARSLNEKCVSCPSRADAARNRHRSGARWTVQSVASILGNPRYTGRQVWNRQKTDHVVAELAERRPGCGVARRRTSAGEWVVSRRVAHEALVSEEDFVAAQAISAVAGPEDGVARRYAMVGLVRCGVCRRRMESCWVHGRPAYRCRHGYSSSAPSSRARPKTVYLREDRIIAQVHDQLQELNLLDAGEVPMIDTDPGLLADIVRHHGLTIVCEASSCTVTTTRTGVSTSAN